MEGLIESTKEASKGGFRGIKKIRGLFIDQKLVHAPETWDTKKLQLLVTMEDVTILEMFEGEDEFTLKDGKYSFYVPYAEEGKRPSNNSIYIKTWVASAEKLGKKPSEFKGLYVTLDKVPTLLFQKPVINEETKKPKLNDDGKKILEDIVVTNYFCFVGDETADSQNVKEYIKSIIKGKSITSATRELVLNTRAKQFPEFKEALKAGVLAEKLGLVLVDDKFEEPVANVAG